MKLDFSKIHTLSNYISFFRILLAIPIFIFISRIDEYEGARNILLILYILAYISDIADGYIARKLNQISELGKIIDPLADKALVFLVVTYLFYFELIPGYYYWIIIFRDIIIFVGGVFVSKRIGKVLPSNYLGKLTVLFIGFYIIIVTMGVESKNIFYQVLFYGSLLLSFASVISYGLRGFKEIKEHNEVI